MGGRPPLVIGVDAAKKTGVGILNNTTGEASALALDGDDQHRINALLMAVPGAIVVVEKHGKPHAGMKTNWAAIESLVQRRMRWQIACERASIRHLEVNNTTWQNKMLMSVTMAAVRERWPKAKGKAFKQRAQIYCRETWGSVTAIEGNEVVETDALTPDERDALCIARWYSLHGWQR
jgi:hypothetical protein